MNRFCILLDEKGEIDRLVADEPIEIYWVDPRVPHDRVYKYEAADFGPQFVRELIGGFAVGHMNDGGLGIGSESKLPPSKPALTVVQPWATVGENPEQTKADENYE